MAPIEISVWFFGRFSVGSAVTAAWRWQHQVVVSCHCLAYLRGHAADWLPKPNLYWFKFGMFLGAFIAPIVMGLVFLLTILPMGLVFRAMGKDPLRLKIDKQAKSYWLKRETPPHSMKNQF